MNLTLTGANAPAVAATSSRVELLYASLAAYSARISADDAAIRGLYGSRVVAAEMSDARVIGAPVGSGAQRVVYTLAPAAPVVTVPSNESPKPRR
jgi:hypothetical protein